MPELPDLVYIEKILNAVLPGKKIIGVSITEPIVFRILIAKGFEEALKNSRFKSVFRHGPFLGFQFENGFELVIHPMLAGKFKMSSQPQSTGRDLCFSLSLQDRAVLQYLDDKKMGKV